MNSGNSRLSLSELRRRTDQQLVVLVRKEIERSLKLAHRGALAEAESITVQARTLLAITRVSDGERAELEARLDALRTLIERRRRVPIAFTNSAWC